MQANEVLLAIVAIVFALGFLAILLGRPFWFGYKTGQHQIGFGVSGDTKEDRPPED